MLISASLGEKPEKTAPGESPAANRRVVLETCPVFEKFIKMVAQAFQPVPK
jgi:hypothetical protein